MTTAIPRLPEIVSSTGAGKEAVMSKQPSNSTASPAIEQTDISPQYLIGGVAPVAPKQRLDFLATLSMTPKRLCRQKPCNIGLFNEDLRNQMDLF